MSTARVVTVPAGAALPDLLDGVPAGLVFSPREQRLCSARPGLTGWAGRLAAKLAVAAEVGLAEGVDSGALRQIEILPDRSACREPAGCTGSHPPGVVLGADVQRLVPAGIRLDVSITHTDVLAMALVASLGERTENDR